MKILKKEKGSILVESAVSAALFAIVMAIAMSVAVSASRNVNKIMEQMNIDHFKSDIEVCFLSETPCKALSFYLEQDISFGDVETVYLDEAFIRTDTKENALYYLEIYVGEDTKYVCIYDIYAGGKPLCVFADGVWKA